jgi:hypothetical protein
MLIGHENNAKKRELQHAKEAKLMHNAQCTKIMHNAQCIMHNWLRTIGRCAVGSVSIIGAWGRSNSYLLSPNS